jgi:hypothetical protein
MRLDRIHLRPGQETGERIRACDFGIDPVVWSRDYSKGNGATERGTVQQNYHTEKVEHNFAVELTMLNSNGGLSP